MNKAGMKSSKYTFYMNEFFLFFRCNTSACPTDIGFAQVCFRMQISIVQVIMIRDCKEGNELLMNDDDRSEYKH